MQYYVCTLHTSPSIQSHSFNVSVPFTCLLHIVRNFELTAYKCTWFVFEYLTDVLYSAIVWIFIMALVIYDAYMIHFHMDPS